MQLDSLTLKNYKNHRDSTFHFKSGVNGIVGKNGQGKSAIIEAVRFVYTGVLDDTKEETITIGETEGYVRATFTLNGKPGSIERHLGLSKVSLKYDDKSYNKAIEVKELWNKLLQIDESIFNNVIVAKQGEIPLLFSGSDTVREKIFQKIFLVPPTEKVRSVIWEHYIKLCSPEHLTEDVSILRGNIAEVVIKLKPIQKNIDETLSRILDDVTANSILTRISFLKKCITDQQARPDLERQLKQVTEQLKDKERAKAEVEVKHAEIDCDVFKKRHNEVIANKQRLERKIELGHTLTQTIKLIPSDDKMAQVEKVCTELNIKINKDQDKVGVLKGQLDIASQALAQFRKLIGCATCPTCNQTIADIQQFIATQQRQHLNLETELAPLVALGLHDKRELSVQQQFIEAANRWKLKLQDTEDELVKYQSVEYSQEEYELIASVLAMYQQQRDQLAELRNQLTQLKGQANLLDNKLKNLAEYDGEQTPEEETALMAQVFETNRARKDEITRLKLEEVKLQTEVRMIEARVELSLGNAKKNEKRNQYMNTLNSLYELFHVSQFPRKLIQSYAGDVQELLLQNIQKFNIPYTPRISEGFKILMFDEHQRNVPNVSGGQKVVVGLALRLALHSLFAQSFPMWIVDEGTTHLDTDNVKMYFDVIKELRKESAIKQVIIIDHNEKLTEVVDHVIKV